MHRSYRTLFIFFFLLLIFIGIGYFFKIKQSNINSSDQYAVFLTNGQIYFGQLSYKDDFIVLKNVYYPQSNDFLRNDGTKKKITLQKLGNELHGPDNFIHINRDQIMYFERLRNDSKVYEAISEATTNPSSPSTSASPSL